MREPELYTAAEVAFVLRQSVRSVKKAFDRGPIRTTLSYRSGINVRTIDRLDLLYLHAVRELSDELTPRAREAFYEALRRTPMEALNEVRLGQLRIALGDLAGEVDSRTAELEALADKVTFRSDGEPLLQGTTIEVHRIAALVAGGMSGEAILEDYPSLSRTDLETAEAYAAAHPKSGRPYPKTTAKRALAGAGLEALDADPGGP